MAAIQTSQTQFSANEQITSAKLNNILLQSSFAAGAVTTDGTLTIISGQMQVGTLKTANFPTDGITTAKIADLTVTTAKLADTAVTTAKITDLNVTTGKITDLAVTTAKIADVNVTTAKVADANITAAKLSGAQTGSAPIYGARAWVRFNGNSPDSSNTARTILASGNVTSVTKNGTGLYTVVFTTALPSANYVAVGSRSYKAADSSGVTIQASSPTSQTSSTFTFYTLDRTAGAANSDDVQVVFFG